MFDIHKDNIAIRSDGKYFLLGGGIENNETHEDCLEKEALEEMGMYIEIGNFVGCARRYFYPTNENNYSLSEGYQGYFYLCDMGRQISKPTVEDHFLNGLNQSRQ